MAVENAGERKIWRGFGNFFQHLAENRFFSFARSENDELAGGFEGGVTERDAARRRFDGGDGAINGGVVDQRFGFAGKKRGGVAVFAHAEDDEIEDGLAARTHRRDAAEFGFGFFGGVGVIGFAVDAMDLFGANVERIEKRLARGDKIGFRIGGRDAAFVGKEEMDVIDVAALGAGRFDEGFVEWFGDAAAGKRDVHGRTVGNRIDKMARGRFGKSLCRREGFRSEIHFLSRQTSGFTKHI